MTIWGSILWRRIDSRGHDFCQIEQEVRDWKLDGTAVFLHHAEPASLSYSIRCNSKWETLSGAVRGTLGLRTIEYVFARRGKNWMLNGDAVPGLEHLIDLDLSFTPATNFTQLRRVAVSGDGLVQLPVAWFDLESGTLKELPQTYQRRDERTLWYEAATVGYQGLLEFESNGFIRHYPGLWEREQAPLDLPSGADVEG